MESGRKSAKKYARSPEGAAKKRAWKLARGPLYAVWVEMRRRCTAPDHPAFENYGRRGIYVCFRWGSYPTFVADMGPRPPGATIERIDNDGPYAPDNVRWATRTEQNRNRRNNRNVTFKGETMTAAEWATRLGISKKRLYWRLARWSVGRALNAPVDKRFSPRPK